MSDTYLLIVSLAAESRGNTLWSWQMCNTRHVTPRHVTRDHADMRHRIVTSRPGEDHFTGCSSQFTAADRDCHFMVKDFELYNQAARNYLLLLWSTHQLKTSFKFLNMSKIAPLYENILHEFHINITTSAQHCRIMSFMFQIFTVYMLDGWLMETFPHSKYIFLSHMLCDCST